MYQLDSKLTRTWFFYITLATTVLALCVIVMGAYTRLADAGLGCPDWPGCYGHLIVPETVQAQQKAMVHFPNQVIEPAKAWKEMIHRYLAGSLGLCILGILLLASCWYKRISFSIFLPIALLVLVIFQAALGMWTVTLRLLPVVVMGHLLGGMLIVSLLCWLTLKNSNIKKNIQYPQTMTNLRGLALLGILILAIQIFLGGWTSANYAALACPDFPYCHGSLFPPMDIQQAFNFWMPIGHNYEGGLLGHAAKVAIQMFHRYGALITLLLLGFISHRLMRLKSSPILFRLGKLLAFVLFIQICLGVLNIELRLPLIIAVAHNSVAALLLLTMVTINYCLLPNKRKQ